MGVEPVARPSTAGLPVAFRSRITVAMRAATSLARSSCSLTTTVRMRSSPVVCGAGGTLEGPRVALRPRAWCPAPTSPGAPVTGTVICRVGSGRERAAAAAAAGRVRVLEGEARALHRRRVVDDDAADVLGRERVDEHAIVTLVDDQIVFRGGVLDQEAVLEAAAPARLHAHAQATDGGIDPFLGHELLDLGARDGRDGHQDFRLIGGAHRSSSV